MIQVRHTAAAISSGLYESVRAGHHRHSGSIRVSVTVASASLSQLFEDGAGAGRFEIVNGRTAIEGLSGRGNGCGEAGKGSSPGAAGSRTRTGRAMFLTLCSPM